MASWASTPTPYRQRPKVPVPVVEAMQLFTTNVLDVAKWCGGAVSFEGEVPVICLNGGDQNYIVHPKDFIVTTPEGGFRKYGEHEFEATFERTPS